MTQPDVLCIFMCFTVEPYVAATSKLRPPQNKDHSPVANLLIGLKTTSQLRPLLK